MGEFLTGKRLKNKIIDIIETAEKKLIIVSPYIKLHVYYKKALSKKTNNKQLQTTLIFRREKAGEAPTISQEDLNFFKLFRNISIYSNRRLHAKLYGNESGLLVTSMNLSKSSQDKDNIEFGVYYPINSSLKHRQDLYIRSNIQLTLQSTITKSTLEYPDNPPIQYDLFTAYYANQAAQGINDMTTPPTEGYCIRTGITIPFNIRKPYCLDAYQEWKQESSPDSKEPFCHLTGVKTGENTTLQKPIAESNWILFRNKFPNFVKQLTETPQLTP